MKKKINYTGKHMRAGVYEVEEDVAEQLLAGDGWSSDTPKSTPKETAQVEESNPLDAYGTTEGELRSMTLKQLRKFAELHDLKSKDSSTDDLAGELINEILTGEVN